MAKSVVIGGGFGGIAAALRLRAKGYSVTLVDRCERLGGRAQVFERNGFRHDAGPTVITAPFLFDELFALFGRRREDYIEFIPLDPWYRFYFADGRTFNYGGSVESTLAEIARFEPADVAGYEALLEKSRQIFDVGFTQLSDLPFDRFGRLMGQVPNLLRLGCYKTVWQMVCSHLKSEPLRQAFSIHPLLVGGNPFETTSIYCLIHYLERKWGIHFAKGGTGALVAALHRLLEEVGVTLRLSTTVDRISVIGDRATGVSLEGGEALDAEVVVSNADPIHLYGTLLRGKDQRCSARLKQATSQLSMGLFVLFFGTRKTYPAVAHHTIWMGERFRDLLEEIFHGDRLPEDFSLYLHRPTATDTSFAPDGCDSFYVLAPVPHLGSSIDWAVEGPLLQARIVKALERTILPELSQYMVDPFYMTPEDFASRYLSHLGAGFSISPIFRQSAWFRFHNKAEGPENLYLVGAGTHPGAGVPGVLSSAKVLDRLVPEAAS
jgi:phytoene desaturase